MSNIDDLLISKMSASERGRAKSEIMKNNPGWSHDDSTKTTLRKLGWNESGSHTSHTSKRGDKLLMLALATPVVCGIIGLLIGLFNSGILMGILFLIGGAIAGLALDIAGFVVILILDLVLRMLGVEDGIGI